MVLEEVQKRYRKNRLFAKHGHVCEMTNDLDVLPQFIPGNSMYSRIKRSIVRLRMVSEISQHSYRFFRSQGAIANENYRHLKHYPFIIHPSSGFRIFWKYYMCFVFLIEFVTIPLDVAYFRDPSTKFVRTVLFKWIRMIGDLSCILDMLMNFFTGYYTKQTKHSVLVPGQIAVHYLRTYFIIDLISSIPTHFDLFFTLKISEANYMLLEFSSLLKFLRYPTFTKYFTDFIQALEISFVMADSVIIAFHTILYIHLVTSLLLMGYMYQLGLYKLIFHYPIPSTLKFTIIINNSYPEALYLAVLLVTSSGFGDVRPKTAPEIIFVIVIWIISKILHILIIAKILQIVKSKTSSAHKYIEMTRQLKEYMRHRQLPDHIQRRLLTYYEFRFQKSYFRESEILNTISGQLRQEIVMHSCRKLVENVAFFRNLPLTLLVRVVSCLKSEIYLVNDVIVRANTPGNAMFFISTGTVAVYTASGREICHLEDGAHFGEIALVMRDELRVASVVAVEVCELYRLDRREFVRAIHPYPDLLENIQRIAADRMEKTTMLDEHNRRQMISKRLY